LGNHKKINTSQIVRVVTVNFQGQGSHTNILVL